MSIYATVPIPRGLNPNAIQIVASIIEPILLDKAFEIFESYLLDSLLNMKTLAFWPIQNATPEATTSDCGRLCIKQINEVRNNPTHIKEPVNFGFSYLLIRFISRKVNPINQLLGGIKIPFTFKGSK